MPDEQEQFPPIPDFPMPEGYVAPPAPSFNEREYDEARKKRVEDAKGFDQTQDVARGVKLTQAAELEHKLDVAKQEKKLDAAFAMDRVEKRDAPQPSQEAVTSVPPKETKPSQAVIETAPPPNPTPTTQIQQSAQGDKSAPSQHNDLSEVMKKLTDIEKLIESLPRLLSQFGRLN